MARNTSVTLGDHFEAFISSKIEQGRFQSVSEAVRAGLRKLEADEARLDELRARLKAGEDSPRIENFDSREFLEKLHKKTSRVRQRYFIRELALAGLEEI